MRFLIDSGADANIIGESDWEKLRNENLSGKAVLMNVRRDPRTNLSGYASASALHVTFVFKAWIETVGVSKPKTLAEFYVVKGGNRSLIGRKSAKSMKILKLGMEVNAVRLMPIEFPSIPGLEVDFDVDEGVQPVRHPYVSIAAHFQEPAVRRLQEMEDAKIVERVEDSPRWLSGLSAVPKGKADFRLVVNMRGPNRAIRRQYHRMPRPEEIKTKLCGAIWFTKLDIASAFHHVKLSPRSRELTTFMAPNGMYRFTRLVFGVNCAPEIFQREMERILSGIDNIVVYIDDVLIFAVTESELAKTTTLVLERLAGSNLSLNEAKCEYAKRSLTFLGHQLSADGLNIDEQKVADIKVFRPPRNTTELKSFLGLVNYVRDFIPHYAELTAALRAVDGKGKFKWAEEQAAAFKALKEKVVRCTVTQGYFSLKDDIELYTDASPFAVGAVLVQVDETGKHRIISFASKALTETESNYAQTQREALAVVWAVEHFSYYLLGAKFLIKTDAEGIRFIFDKSSDKPKRLLRRAEAWKMRLDLFDYAIEFVSGVLNIADSSSRLFEPTDEPVEYEEERAPCEIAVIELNDVEDVRFDSDHLPIEEVRMATEESEELQRVIKCIEAGKWTADLGIYSSVEEELATVDGLVLKSGLVVIPPKLRDKATGIAHSGHLGITKTKSVLKERVWWPRMNQSVEDWVKACVTCTLNGRQHVPTPMMRSKLPEAPWDGLAIDHCGPFASLGDFHIVGIVDYFTRYVTAALVRSTGWVHLEPLLTELFDRMGDPLTIKSDNGPPFSGDAYKEFCRRRGVQVVFSWPLNPQQNGAAEATMKLVGRAIQNATAEGSDIGLALRHRVRAHNNAVHTETGRVPSELMYGRRLRRGLPLARPTMVPLNPEEMRERDWTSKLKGKVAADGRRHAKEADIVVGDKVVQIRAAKRKGETTFDPTELVVTARNRSDLTMMAPDGRVIRRDITKVRKLPPTVEPIDVAGRDGTVITVPAPVEQAAPGATTETEQAKRVRKPTARLNYFVEESADLDMDTD